MACGRSGLPPTSPASARYGQGRWRYCDRTLPPCHTHVGQPTPWPRIQDSLWCARPHPASWGLDLCQSRGYQCSSKHAERCDGNANQPTAGDATLPPTIAQRWLHAPLPIPSSLSIPWFGAPSGAPAQLPLYHPSWLDPRLQQHPPSAANTQATSAANNLPALDSAMSLVSATSAMSLSSDIDVLQSGDSAHSHLSHMSICPSTSSLETPEMALVNAGPASAPSYCAGGAPQTALPLPPAVPQPSYIPPGCFTFTATQQIAPAVLPGLPTLTIPDLPFRELDKLWDLKVVYTPPSMRPWPAGVFARDMARALLFIGDTDSEGTLQGPKTLAARFEYVFQGRPFKSATYQAQRVAWVNSTQEQREWIMTRPRTRDGLWTECRKQLTGWKTSGSHKRGKGKYRDDGDGGDGSEPGSD